MFLLCRFPTQSFVISTDHFYFTQYVIERSDRKTISRFHNSSKIVFRSLKCPESATMHFSTWTIGDNFPHVTCALIREDLKAGRLQPLGNLLIGLLNTEYQLYPESGVR
jgi:hypothetical protein